MGPPELPGGNEAEKRWELPQVIGLQWGRRNYPAETDAFIIYQTSERNRFNGAAGITRRKLGIDVSLAEWAEGLQWGRRNYPAETSSQCW